MRFLVSEKTYETPLAGGKFVYAVDDAPTGAVEQWRYTLAPHDFTILRVDYDARNVDGSSILYHLIQQPDGALERLTYRYLHEDGSMVAGNVLFSAETITNSRSRNNTRHEDAVLPTPFAFTAASGLGLLARQLKNQPQSDAIVILNTDVAHSNEAHFSLQQHDVQIRPQRTREIVPIAVGKTIHSTTYLTVQWQDESIKLWRDHHQWPLKVQYANGLSAQATQYILYQRQSKS